LEEVGMSTLVGATGQRDVVEAAARRRAGLVAAVAGLVLLPWFWLAEALVGFQPVSPPLGAPDEEFIDFYVENSSRIPLNATLFIGQWVIILVLLVSMVMTTCRRMHLTAALSVTLAGAATAIYVGAEGVRVWPVMAAGMDAENLRNDLDSGLAQAATLSRDGLHAPASVLLGIAVLLIAWLLARSDLWGRWVMSGLAVVAGAFALSSVVVGPEGFGPGFIFVLWGPVSAVVLLIGRRRLGAASTEGA
jgi:hypothetical protein